MRKFLASAATVAFVAAAAQPAAADDRDRPCSIRWQHDHGQDIRASYLRAYRKAKHRFGSNAVGRNIVCRGIRRRKVRHATRVEVRRAQQTLQRWLHPPTRPDQPVTPTPNTGAMPYCTWGPESGGNYTARNPVSTAGGKYQILDTTWHDFGGPDYPGTHDAAQAPPALQEQIARAVLAGQGLDAWTNCPSNRRLKAAQPRRLTTWASAKARARAARAARARARAGTSGSPYRGGPLPPLRGDPGVHRGVHDHPKRGVHTTPPMTTPPRH